MIDRKDIKEMRHDEDGECVGFALYVQPDEDEQPVRFGFTRIGGNDGWEVLAVVDVKGNDRVYRVAYGMPKKGMSLELIAAVGLYAVQILFKDDMQRASLFDIAIGELVQGM